MASKMPRPSSNPLPDGTLDTSVDTGTSQPPPSSSSSTSPASAPPPRGCLSMSHIPAWSSNIPSPTSHLHLFHDYSETYQYIQLFFNQLLAEDLSIDHIKTMLSSPLYILVNFVHEIEHSPKNIERVGPVIFRYLECATRHDGSDEAVHNDELLFISLSKNESEYPTYVAVPRPHALYVFLQMHIKEIHDHLKSACLSLFQPSGYGFIFESCAVNALSNSTSLPITSPSQNSE
jgi:hypothetical protein